MAALPPALAELRAQLESPRKDHTVKFDDETVRRILDATFGAVETDVAAEAVRGPLVHAFGR
jgi:hypothetical protein